MGPTVADVDQDGSAEIIAGSNDWDAPNRVHVWRSDGSLLPGWPRNVGGKVITSAAAGDLDHDGRLEIVASTWADYDFSSEARVFVWNIDGEDLGSWPKSVITLPGLTINLSSTPSLGDIDGDGYLEIVVGFADGTVHVWNFDGTEVPGWPAVAHVDGTYRLIRTSIGDMDSDGALEVIGVTIRGEVHVWDRTGVERPGWPVTVPNHAMGEAALADLDRDSHLEIIAHSNIDAVYAWHDDATPVTGWPVQAKPIVGNGPWPQPVVNDIDENGFPDVIAVSNAERKVFAWTADGQPVPGWPRLLVGPAFSSVAVGDVDGDHLLEVVAADRSRVYMWDLPVHYSPASVEWPQYQHDAWHTGLYQPPCSPILPDGDQDGVMGACDDCPSVYNPSQSDGDSDGVGDVCDICPSAYDPWQVDGDGDGIGAACDNCAAVYNPSQTNSDGKGDGGDACDMSIYIPLDGTGLCGGAPPKIQWTTENYNRFRVFVSWDPNFRKGKTSTSGDALLKVPFWIPPVKKWNRGCAGANPSLYIRVLGKIAGKSMKKFSDDVILEVK
jgi:WD40 repeat protein